MGGNLKARGAGGSSSCGGPKGKKKNGRNRGGKANNPPYLPPEAEDGNIEYKLKLVNPSQYRFEHLVTQMKWRLQEGRGEAVYQIGVEDNGLLVGLAEEEMRASLKTLHRMAEKYASSSPPPTLGRAYASLASQVQKDLGQVGAPSQRAKMSQVVALLSSLCLGSLLPLIEDGLFQTR